MAPLPEKLGIWRNPVIEPLWVVEEVIEHRRLERPMQIPMDQEAATADLISDIVAPAMHRAGSGDAIDAEVCAVAHDLSSGSERWKQAWSLRPAEPV